MIRVYETRRRPLAHSDPVDTVRSTSPLRSSRRHPFLPGAMLALTALALPAAARGQDGMAPWPSVRGGHVLVHDAARGETLLIGGDSEDMAQTTDSLWAWSGEAWRVVPAPGPGWRTLPAAAFDTRRERVLLFGGLRKFGQRQYSESAEGDTWAWNGGHWEPLAVGSPGPIDHHAMVWDDARGVLVVQGGGSGGQILPGDTWTLDGERWTRAAAADAGPGPRVHHAMAYDSRRQRVVLFGGFSEAGDPPADVWEWDGHRWHRIPTVGVGPGPRRRHRMAFDEARGVTVLFGGNDDPSTWTWDGTEWRVAATDGPPARNMHAMAWDTRRARIILFGGGYPLRNDLWEWDGVRWEERRGAASLGTASLGTGRFR